MKPESLRILRALALRLSLWPPSPSAVRSARTQMSHATVAACKISMRMPALSAMRRGVRACRHTGFLRRLYLIFFRDAIKLFDQTLQQDAATGLILVCRELTRPAQHTRSVNAVFSR